MQESILFLVRLQCRRKESSRSLSHLLMSFLYSSVVARRIYRIACVGGSGCSTVFERQAAA